MAREVTTELIHLVEQGLLDAKIVMLAALNYMSEEDVADMAWGEGFVEEGDEYEY